MLDITKEAIDKVKKEFTDKDGKVIGYSFDFGEVNKEITKTQERLRDLNKDAIEALRPKLDKLKKEVDDLNKQVFELTQRRRAFERQQTKGWQQLAAELGIKKYLTANGSFSMAKVRKLPMEEGQSILDIYNKQYVPQVNALMKQQREGYVETAEDRALVEQYNAKVREYNSVATQMRGYLGM